MWIFFQVNGIAIDIMTRYNGVAQNERVYGKEEYGVIVRTGEREQRLCSV